MGAASAAAREGGSGPRKALARGGPGRVPLGGPPDPGSHPDGCGINSALQAVPKRPPAAARSLPSPPRAPQHRPARLTRVCTRVHVLPCACTHVHTRGRRGSEDPQASGAGLRVAAARPGPRGLRAGGHFLRPPDVGGPGHCRKCQNLPGPSPTPRSGLPLPTLTAVAPAPTPSSLTCSWGDSSPSSASRVPGPPQQAWAR